MRKKLFNSKIIFTITLVFVLCCFMATSSWAARKCDITSKNAKGFIGQLNQNGAEMSPVFGLSADDGFQLIRKIETGRCAGGPTMRVENTRTNQDNPP